MAESIAGNLDSVVFSGQIKWFDASKGFGFIVADDGGPDILLHANVLRNFGQSSIAERTRISVRAHSTQRGLQASEIVEIQMPENVADAGAGTPLDLPDVPSDAPVLAARIKWFDKAKGFGFANVFGEADDVFVHVEVLRRAGFSDLQAGEAVAMKVVEGPRGKLAAEILSWDYL